MHFFDLVQPMFVNGTCPGKSWKKGFWSPGKPWNLVFASPGKSVKKAFLCLYKPWWKGRPSQRSGVGITTIFGSCCVTVGHPGSCWAELFCLTGVVFRPHRMHCMDAAYCYRWHTESVVCVLGSCVKTSEPIKMPFGDWLMWTQGTTCISWSSRSLHWIERGNFGDCPTHWKALGVSAAVYAAIGIGMIQSLR